MMVGYVHDSTTTWRIWDPEFKTIRTQSDVIFDEERNAYVSCPQSLKRKHGTHAETTEIDIFDLPQEKVHTEIIDKDPGGTDEEMIHGRTRESRAGDSISHGRTRSGKVAPDNMAGADAGLPSHTTGHNDGQGDRSPPAAGAGKVGLTHMAPDEDAHTHTYTDTDVLTGSRHQTLDSHDQAPSRDEITTNRSIRRQINSVRRSVVATKKPKTPAIIPTDRVTRSSTRANAQVNVSELIYSALTSTTVNDDPRTYDEAMSGPLKHEWEAAILEEAKSIQRNVTPMGRYAIKPGL
jgi:hypothetical protein